MTDIHLDCRYCGKEAQAFYRHFLSRSKEMSKSDLYPVCFGCVRIGHSLPDQYVQLKYEDTVREYVVQKVLDS